MKEEARNTKVKSVRMILPNPQSNNKNIVKVQFIMCSITVIKHTKREVKRTIHQGFFFISNYSNIYLSYDGLDMLELNVHTMFEHIKCHFCLK